MDLNKLTHKGGLPASPRSAVLENINAPAPVMPSMPVQEQTQAKEETYNKQEFSAKPVRNVQRDKNDPEYIKGETIYLSNKEWDKLKVYAKEKGLRKSDIISELIERNIL